MRYAVHTRYSIQCIADDAPHIIISIADAEDTHPPVPQSVGCRGVLSLVFNDIDRPRDGYVCFDDEMAEQVLDFWLAHHDVETVYVHCNGGQCRSPGIAAALQRLDGESDDLWFRQKTPNLLVYRTLLTCGYGRGLLS